MIRVKLVVVAIVAAIITLAALTWRHARASEIKSGLPIGETLVEFRPWHASGPDKGTMECPLCKYPKFPGVQVWVNDDTETNIVAIAKHLDKLVASTRSKNLKAFVVYANVNHDPDQPLHQAVSELAARNRLTNVALVVLPAWDKQAVARNEINTDPRVRNTVYVYKKLRVSNKFVNLVPDARGLGALDSAVSGVLQ